MNIYRTLPQFALGMALLLAVGGCGGSKVLPTSGPRNATKSWEVQILEDKPSAYEILGVVETTENLGWDKNASAETVVNALKKKAAALGATGLLMEAEGSAVRAAGMYNGKMFQIPIDKVPATKAMATAVYIVKP